jgi:hypothetical protein
MIFLITAEMKIDVQFMYQPCQKSSPPQEDVARDLTIISGICEIRLAIMLLPILRLRKYFLCVTNFINITSFNAKHY